MKHPLLAACVLAAAPSHAADGAVDRIVLNVCRIYLLSSASGNADLARAVRTYRGPVEPVISQLEAVEETHWERATGIVPAQHFSAPGLKSRYKDDLLYFYVPPEYDASRPFGLLIFMHGGGSGTRREYAGVVVAGADEEPSYHLRPHIDHAPFITVAPSAPWNGKDDARWNVPEADDYITAVIQECRYRFNLDRDRVFLGGWSMGGFGAYHLCQRLSDRIAGGLLGAGCWGVSDWRCMVGTPLFLIHGATDAVPPGRPGKEARPRYTDVFYARAAHELLTQAGAEHIYAEYEGGHHPREAGKPLADFVEWTRTRVRDPFSPHVVALTARGWQGAAAPPAPHNRWVSILETGDGQLPYDAVERTGPSPEWGESAESFRRQGFELKKVPVKAGLVDARYQGDNVFEVRAGNVKKRSLWLHPRMVRFEKPVMVVLNGAKKRFRVKPTLLDALRSYERRQDWGLVYHCELVVDVP